LTTGVPPDPSSITSMRTPSGTPTSTIVTEPSGEPDAVCMIALVTSSDVSRVATSGSTRWPGPAADSVRVTKARAPETSSARPRIVSEPRIAVRASSAEAGPGAGRLFRGVSICASLPM
jgi:hypothetical protein